jgi:pyruvate dehydrogenase E2 component (dihydrolipoamide acetyltransferase)
MSQLRQLSLTPSLTPIYLPKWGLTVEDGVVTEWLVVEGQPVKAGQVLVLVETDKATGEVGSPASGRLKRILKSAGTSVKPGEALGEIETGNDPSC